MSMFTCFIFFVLGVKRLTFNSVFFNSLETKSGAVNPGERPSPFMFTQCLKSTICTLVKEDLREFPNPETPALKLVIIIFETPFPLPWESISQSFFVFSASRLNIGKSCCCTYHIYFDLFVYILVVSVWYLFRNFQVYKVTMFDLNRAK